jgi:hypothetical protein
LERGRRSVGEVVVEFGVERRCKTFFCFLGLLVVGVGSWVVDYGFWKGFYLEFLFFLLLVFLDLLYLLLLVGY